MSRRVLLLSVTVVSWSALANLSATMCTVLPKIQPDFPRQRAKLGALTPETAKFLFDCGIRRINHNLETSERHYPNIVSTHPYSERVNTLKIAKEAGTLMIIPNAGLDAATGALCAPNIFRTSFSNWQPSYPMGKVLADRGVKNVVTLAWKYGAGEEATAGFSEGFIKAGGKSVRGLWVPFPNVEFQALLTEIASIKPDAVFVFFAGGGAAKFIKDYAAAGLRKQIPLFGSGFLTDGVLDAVDDAAQGIETTLHYGDGLDTKPDRDFRSAYSKAYKSDPDVYAVQGYDAALLLAVGVNAAKGDITKKKEMIAAMEKAKIDSPRGTWTMSKAHNPIQDIYLRKVVGRENKVIGVAHKALADPARGCKM